MAKQSEALALLAGIRAFALDEPRLYAASEAAEKAYLALGYADRAWADSILAAALRGAMERTRKAMTRKKGA